MDDAFGSIAAQSIGVEGVAGALGVVDVLQASWHAGLPSIAKHCLPCRIDHIHWSRSWRRARFLKGLGLGFREAACLILPDAGHDVAIGLLKGSQA